MFHIIGCITSQHDLSLVAIAAIICSVGSFTTMQMLARAQASAGLARLAWVLAGGVAFGSGVWVTHFIAMLAYSPAISIGFNLPLTFLSLLIAIVGGWLALANALSPRRGASLIAGLLFGVTIGAMHFTGMVAFQVPGVVEYGMGDAALAWLAALVFAPAALQRFRVGRLGQASFLLVLAVLFLHFISMAGVTIRTNGSVIVDIARTALAVVVAALGLLVLISSLATALVDRYLERRRAVDNTRFRRFADATFEGLFFLHDGVVSDANAVLCRMLGRPVEAIIGAKLTDFFAPSCGEVLEALQQGDLPTIEADLVDRHGDRLVVDVLVRTLGVDADATAVIAVRDASERKKAERRIQELVHIDPLTGLANRLLLQDRLGQALAMAERSGGAVAVLCLDLDGFKAVNDIMGHHAGDLVLIEVANRLRATVRDIDTVARQGGDEFTVVQPLTGDMAGGAQILADRLMAVLREPYLVDGSPFEVTASIGIACYPEDAHCAEMLLVRGDLALYRAKQDGQNRYRCFEPAMDSDTRARHAMKQDLRHALANRELHLVYQPVFDSGQLGQVGYEALLRWIHPVRGVVSPAEFIPVAEQCGAILPIGLWVLETACAEAASWPGNLGIAVNLSPAQFHTRELPDQVAAILARTGLAPERLELEVTEGVLMDDTERALAILGALKAQGIRIALDDFGTGYSSLSYLRRFPFDRLKIDRSFVTELGTNEDADAIVHCILAMSHSLHLAVTAEGVETEQQLALLRKLGCDHLQGYLLGRPHPPAALFHLVHDVAAA